MVCTGSIMANLMDEQIEAGEHKYNEYCKLQYDAVNLLDVFGCSRIGDDKDGNTVIVLNKARPQYQPKIIKDIR